MSAVYYPSIYDNTYNYAELANNSIVITTQSGFGAVAAAENTVIICNNNGQWVTSSLDNYATSSDITNIQNSIDTLSTYSDILQQSITSNLTAINSLKADLADNYFTKEEITSSADILNNYFDSIDEHLEDLTRDVSIATGYIIWMFWTEGIEDFDSEEPTSSFKHLADGYSNFFMVTDEKGLHGVYKLYGTVTLYISDITKMTPKVDGLTPYEWCNSLPKFSIELKSDHPSYHGNFIPFNATIEANNPLVTIPIDVIFGADHDFLYLESSISSGNWNNINITPDDIYIYSYNLFLERINRSYVFELPEKIIGPFTPPNPHPEYMNPDGE